MRICFICNELPPASSGGIGPCVATLADAIAAQGHEVTVAGIYTRDLAWPNRGFNVRPLILPRLLYGKASRPIAPILLHRHLQRLHSKTPFDIVEWPDYEGLFLRELRGATSVMRNHGPGMSHRVAGLTTPNPLMDWMEMNMMRRMKHWIGVSEWFLAEWLRLTGAKPLTTTVIHNPVDCSLFAPPAERRCSEVVLYAGSLIERKGVFALARAARAFLRDLPKARLVLAGRELVPCREKIVKIAGASVSDRIEFRGPVSQRQLASLMKEATVFAMPSLLESFGTVWAEALASGLPVVGSTLSAGPEVVPDGRAGLLVDPHEPDQVAEAVTTLMTNQELRESFSEYGRRFAVEKYSVESTTRRTIAHYSQLLSAAAN